MDNIIMPLLGVFCPKSNNIKVRKNTAQEHLFSEIKNMILNDVGSSYNIKNNSKYRDLVLGLTTHDTNEVLMTLPKEEEMH